MDKQWYVIHAYSGYETKVREALIERIERLGMDEFFGEIMVPSEEVVEMKGGQERKTQRKFFPGYVLVNMELNDDSWHLVRSTPKVTAFIGTSSQKPTPIKDKEVETILQRMDDSKVNPTQKMTFEVGEAVRVLDGPFKDFTGTVEEINYEKSKLRVSVVIFGRATPVELEFGQIEKEV